MPKSLTASLALVALSVPVTASAHEVYVLDEGTIARDVTGTSPNPLQMIAQEPQQFVLWGIVGVILVSTVFALSISHWLERIATPVLRRLKPFAAPIARVTLGICLLASAYNAALYGPELPLASFGVLAPFLTAALAISGALILVGFYTRAAALLAGVTFALGLMQYGSYMATYSNYLGEILLVGVLGSGRFSVDALRHHTSSKQLAYVAHRLEPYAFPLLRVLFGISIIFASYYAKFLHSQLALDVVTHYHLASYFPFPPLFTVLGALIVETLIGLFILVGFEIRHTALFFLFWIFLSLFYFGESVWPHLVLVGVLVALFCHGYDHYSIQGYIFKRNNREPVL